MERLDVQGKVSVTHCGGIIQANRVFVLSLRDKFFCVNMYLKYVNNKKRKLKLTDSK
jgi:hypothetical protein